MNFSVRNRDKFMEQTLSQCFDVVVIGGGITGAGIALDAASRGLTVLVLEMQDFAAGTSSRSTKLIHGGLRYLKQFDFQLVAEVGKEREIVHQNVPHLSKPEPMLLPIVEGGSFGVFTARIGMFVYEILAGVKKTERHKVLSKEALTHLAPSLQPQGLKSAVLFYEYRTDDARLTIEVLKEAARYGAIALNYTQVEGFEYQNGEICSVKVKDLVKNEGYSIASKYVVNAAGPWVDNVDDLDNASNVHKLHLTKGVHIVVDKKRLPLAQSVYFDTFDKRMIFAIPRQNKIYIGTTDTFYQETDLQHPKVLLSDVKYLLQCINAYFPTSRLSLEDVESSWVGLRPLVNKPGKGPSEISRKDELFEARSGLITIAGGKLTGYRKMAEKIVDLISKKVLQSEGLKVPLCKTQNLKISGGQLPENLSFKVYFRQKVAEGLTLGLSEQESKNLLHLFGSNVESIYAKIKSYSSSFETLPHWLRAMCEYAIEEEMCGSLSDFLVRRSGMIYFDIQLVQQHKESLNRFMAKELQWNETQAKNSLQEFEFELGLVLSYH